MGCCCEHCGVLRRRTLSQLPNHQDRPRLVKTIVSKLLLGCAQQQSTVELHGMEPFEYNMPDTYWLHKSDGAPFYSTFFAIYQELDIQLEILETNPVIFVFQLIPNTNVPDHKQMQSLVVKLLRMSVHFAAEYEDCYPIDTCQQKHSELLKQSMTYSDHKETQLMQIFITHIPTDPIARCFPYMYGFEYEPERGRTDKGKGDLLLTNGMGLFLLVEFKHLDKTTTGATAKVRRTKKRKYVFKQAQRMCKQMRHKLGEESLLLLGATYTNESPTLQLVWEEMSTYIKYQLQDVIQGIQVWTQNLACYEDSTFPSRLFELGSPPPPAPNPTHRSVETNEEKSNPIKSNPTSQKNCSIQ
jgi:hypothetical protein